MSPVIAVTAMGTVCRLSSRLLAVTMISSALALAGGASCRRDGDGHGLQALFPLAGRDDDFLGAGTCRWRLLSNRRRNGPRRDRSRDHHRSHTTRDLLDPVPAPRTT
jgi:hypothetical protein